MYFNLIVLIGYENDYVYVVFILFYLGWFYDL